MEPGLGDEVGAMDAVGGKYLQGKDGDHSLKVESGSLLESHEMTTPGESQYYRGFSPALGTILEGKELVRGGMLEHQFATPHSIGDTGGMVEELTLKNFNSQNLPIVGTSNNRDKTRTRQNQWQNLYQIASGIGTASTWPGALQDCGQPTSSAWEDVGYTVFPELLSQKPSDEDHSDGMEHQPNNENNAAASNVSTPCGGIRTKILSNSGFSQYFVKNTLKGKGVICKGPAREAFGMELRGKTSSKAASNAVVAIDTPLCSSIKTSVIPTHGIVGGELGPYLNGFHDGVTLREWLRGGKYKANKVKSLYIFRQIVDLVDFSHSRGVILHDLRPSSFKLLPSNQVVYIGSSVRQGTAKDLIDQDSLLSENDRNEKRPREQAMHPYLSQVLKKQKFGESINSVRQWPMFPSRSGSKASTANIAGPHDSWNERSKEHRLRSACKSEGNSASPDGSDTSPLMSACAGDPLEEKWYTSPEELSGMGCTFPSNIYVLGVFLFELLVLFESERARATAMSDLCHRILPPNFLSEKPKEAGFCLWLLHPEPLSRPTAREVLQSDVMSGIQESVGDELSSSINQDDTESELLLHFLDSLKDQRQNDALKLVEEIKCLETDIVEVERRQTRKPLVLSGSRDSLDARGNRFLHSGSSAFEVHRKLTPRTNNELMLKNIDHLERAYFAMRSSVQLSDSNVATRPDIEILKERDNVYRAQNDKDENTPSDDLGAFFSGLCKYARYSKFEVRGTLRNGDFQNSANVICSLSFDRDQEYFAAAGVSRRIKIFEFQALFNEAVDIHYPAVEMSNKSKLSCVCWNSYIRNYLASTDYDGIVKLWDAGTCQGFSQYIEHNKRAWSVDFSQVDPTRLASGSDDCTVKLWNINERNSLCTIRNIANVCCVQFSAHSSHLLAFGSADYKTYCYDLRNVSSPWCVLAGHDKAVSYVKFLDSGTLVSASTDNTLKLWDLKKTSSAGFSTSACISTLKGHTNEKNFVGLTVADGYIACGSETNEVYAYYRSLPMPITSHKFGSVDPISGKETDDDGGQFVSSVCWRQKSDMLVAANSTGCIKVLQMVSN